MAIRKLGVALGPAGFAAFLAAGTFIRRPAIAEPRESTPAQKEIGELESRIERIETETLARAGKETGDPLHGIKLLGKLLLFDPNLSVNRNEACAFCHIPETGFTGAISALNASTVASSTMNKRQLGNLRLTDEQENRIVAFLKTLTDGFSAPNHRRSRK
jgi:cytochrome c peroxidase